MGLARIFTIALLALAGCAGVEPLAVFPGAGPGRASIGAVTSDGFLVKVGDDLLAVAGDRTEWRRGLFAGSFQDDEIGAVSADGAVVIWTTYAGGVFLRFARSGETVTLTEPIRRDIADGWHQQPVAVTRDGSRIAYALRDEVRVLALPDRSLVASLPAAAARWLAFSPDGTKLACGVLGAPLKSVCLHSGNFHQGELLVFDVATRERLVRHASPFRGFVPSRAVFSPNSGSLFVPVSDGLLSFDLHAYTRRLLEDLGEGGAETPASSVLFAPACTPRWFTLASDERIFDAGIDGLLHVHDRVLGRETAAFRALAWDAHVLLLSADERTLLVGGNGLALFDAATGALRRIVLAPSTSIVKIVHRGDDLLVTHVEAEPVVVERRLGRVIGVGDGPAGVMRAWNIASPDGALEARAISTADIGVFRFRSDERLWRGAGGTAWSFSPDSKRLAIASSDLRLHDARTGELLATLREDGPAKITAVAFSPDGRELACGCEDGSVVIYAVPRR